MAKLDGILKAAAKNAKRTIKPAELERMLTEPKTATTVPKRSGKVVPNNVIARAAAAARQSAGSKDVYVAPSREGKLHLSVWLEPEFKSALRTIQAMHPHKTLQDLYGEALGDLFTKYGLRIPSNGKMKAGKGQPG